MNGNRKGSVFFRSDDGEWLVWEDCHGKQRFLRTALGKNNDYGRELRSGRVEMLLPFDRDYKRYGQPLTAEEKAYRKGFRACFAEMQRMKRGRKR